MKRYKQYAPAVATALALFALWELFVAVKGVQQWLLPAPHSAIQALWESRNVLAQHAIYTVGEALAGLGIAIVLGLAVAIVMYFSHAFRRAIYPLLIVSQTIPFIVLAPLLVVWFGFGVGPKILVVALVCFFPIIVSLMEGFDGLDRAIDRNMRALGATRWQTFKWAVLPSSMPFFFAGLRIAATYALLTAVVAEWIGAQSGLGIYITRVTKSYQTDQAFATVFVISAISLLFVGAIHILQKNSMSWRKITN